MVRVIVGTQFGDEGKGRAVELLAPTVSVVARYQGGANAGHMIHIKGESIVFRLIPSGIIYPHVFCVMGNGVAIDPSELIREIKFLKSKGINVGHRLFISEQAHVVMPYHKLLDDPNGNIGTTRRGIGPCYEAKYARKGIRVADLLDPEILKYKIKMWFLSMEHIRDKHFLELQIPSLEAIYEQYKTFGNYIAPFVADTALLMNRWIDENKEILLEGAQGLLLDVDHGTYPFVTSSHPHSGGACCGLGIGPTRIDEVIGITKAYITRVGNGPLPTRMSPEDEEKIREKGKEYGATTGRPRKCGWFDAILTKRAILVNNIKRVIITKLDVLDELDEIKVCTEYKIEAKKIFLTGELEVNFDPIYETLPGWKTPTHHIRKYHELPEAAKNYVDRISSLLGVETIAICVGPTKEETVWQ